MQTKLLFNPLSGELDLVRSENIPIFLDENSTIADIKPNATHIYIGNAPLTIDLDTSIPFPPLPIPTQQNFSVINNSGYSFGIISSGGGGGFSLSARYSYANGITITDGGGGFWEANPTTIISYPNLQQVLSAGNISINTQAIFRDNIVPNYETRFYHDGFFAEDIVNNNELWYNSRFIRKESAGNKTFFINIPNLSANANFSSFAANFRPNVTGTVAYLEDIPIYLDETSTIADFQTGRTHYYIGEAPITFDYDALPYPLPAPVSGFSFVNLSVYDTVFTSNGGNFGFTLKPDQALQDITITDGGSFWEIQANEYIDNIYDLQQVTNKGATTTNAIIVRNSPDTYRTRYSTIGQQIIRSDLGNQVNYSDTGVLLSSTGTKTFAINLPDLTSNAPVSSFTVNFRPAVSGTVAYLSDITGGVTAGDKGDITVTLSPETWTIDNNVVTNTKLAQGASNTIKSNPTAALANEQDFAVTTNSLVGRGTGNITNIAFTDFIQRISGTTANRSAVYPSPLIGQLYSNTTTSQLEWYDGTVWRSMIYAQILLTQIQNIANNRFLGNLTGVSNPPQEIAGLDIWDSVAQSYTYNIGGINEWLNATIFTQTASQTVANTVTETALLGTGQGTLVLPASFFVVGKTLKCRIQGFIGDDVTPPTIRIQVKLNAVTILDTTATPLLTITGSRRFELEFELTNRTTGVSGTIFSQGLFKYFRDNTTEEKIAMLNTATNTINTTIAQTLSVTVIWGTANANNTITSTNSNLTKLA